MNSKSKFFYFVHSYAPFPEEKFEKIGVTKYGCKFVSMVWHNNILLTQFHPEKSSYNGIELIKSFLCSLK